MRDSDDQNRQEEGFVLVTAIVLIAILTILGAVSFFKTNVEIKVSKSSGDTAKALAVANGALVQAFVGWGAGGSFATEWSNDPYSSITRDVRNGTDTVAVYIPALAPSTMDDLVSDATAAAATAGSCTNGTTDVLDNYICWADGSSTNPLLRVYELNGGAMNVVANNTWGSGANPQAAVWTTRFGVPTAGYPYDTYKDTDTATPCPDCRVVTYALGRTGDAKRLVRETQSAVSMTLQGVDAITNAPQYATWQDACDETFSTGVGSALSWSGAPAPDVLIEATQSPYVLADRPSGTAMSSNANMGGGGKMFRNDVNSTSELTMDSTPLIAYSLHGSASGVRVKGANTAVDATAADDPSPDLPTDIMLAGLSAGADKMGYFVSGNAQLFNLDAYRWAAEQFTCQNSASGTAANGAFCAKAEALKTAMGSTVPVTGRLTLAQFEKNVADGRPMFGIVRVMYPTTTFLNTGQNCVSAGRNVWLYDLPATVNNMKVGNGRFYTFTSSSKVIVYGMLLMDYFTDVDNDGYFDAATERLIEPIESVDAYLKIEMPLLVNPAIPYNGGTGGNFYTIAATAAPSGSTASLTAANRVNSGPAESCTTCRAVANLASPYDGWFPSTEGMLSVTTSYVDGSMRLMDLTHGAPHGNGLMGAAQQMAASGATTTGVLAGTLFTTHKDRLNYYYETMYTTTDQGDNLSWPITNALPTSFANNFCIGAQDCGAGNNNGDKFHLLFPNGYVHGIKVALAALNIKAAEWNNVLSGNGGKTITQLATAHATRVSYGDATNPLGSPFGQDGTVTDAGIANAAAIEASQSAYFSITEDATSGYGIIDSDFTDLPALAYSGGLIDTHSYSNIGGILYTPGPLEWEPGNKGGLGYVAGSVITGFGIYNKSGGDKAHQIYVFDPQAVDNIAIQSVTILQRRYAWQELK